MSKIIKGISFFKKEISLRTSTFILYICNFYSTFNITLKRKFLKIIGFQIIIIDIIKNKKYEILLKIKNMMAFLDMIKSCIKNFFEIFIHRKS